MPNLRGNTSAKKRRRQNKVQRAKKNQSAMLALIVKSSFSHLMQFQSSNTVECHDGSVSDNNKESCDAVEPEVVSGTNDTLTCKDRQLMKKRDRSSKYYYLNHKKALINERSIVIHIKMKYLLTQSDIMSLTATRD